MVDWLIENHKNGVKKLLMNMESYCLPDLKLAIEIINFENTATNLFIVLHITL